MTEYTELATPDTVDVIAGPTEGAHSLAINDPLRRNVWTPERVEILKRLYEVDGRSANDIAWELGDGFTRNAVIGKLNRLGLKKGKPPIRVTVSSRPKKPRIRSRTREVQRVERIYKHSRAVSHVKVETVQVPDLPDESEIMDSCLWPRATVLNVKHGMCRWPVNDPLIDAEFFFCGRESVEGHSYCPNHCQLSYRKTRRENGTTPVGGWVEAMVKQAKKLAIRSAAEVPAMEEQGVSA